jgi:hypothetical protein
MSTDAEHPWRKSKSGNVYCRWNDLPERIRVSLTREDNFSIKIGDYSYKVREFDDNVLVFREGSG